MLIQQYFHTLTKAYKQTLFALKCGHILILQMISSVSDMIELNILYRNSIILGSVLLRYSAANEGTETGIENTYSIKKFHI